MKKTSKKTTDNIVYFLQVGAKKDGRIIKNEEYEIKKFFDMAILRDEHIKNYIWSSSSYSFYDRFFLTEKYFAHKRKASFVYIYLMFKKCFSKGVYSLIDEDEKGKKRR